MKPLTTVSATLRRLSHKDTYSTLESSSRMHRTILYEASSAPSGEPSWPVAASLDLVAKFLGSTAPLHSSLNSTGEEIDELFISITMRLKLARRCERIPNRRSDRPRICRSKENFTCIHRSHRACQHGTSQYCRMLKAHHLINSMSTTANQCRTAK